jgi:NTP pyrophosphatase (non-canonical NTP hydrolase)
MNLNELKYKAAKISDEKFGRENPVSAPILKLVEEIGEVLECLEKGTDPQIEFADCFLLLVDAYRKYYGDNVDMQALIDISSKKLDVVARRKWGKPNEHGVYKHIKE